MTLAISNYLRGTISSLINAKASLPSSLRFYSMSSRPVQTPGSSSSSRKSLAPAASFADVLGNFAKKDEVMSTTQRIWARSSLPISDEDKPSITFQKIDIREGNDSHGASEIHLFGVTKTGNSLLARVKGFNHYFYYPAPAGFTEDDLNPLRESLNALPALTSRPVNEQAPVVSYIELEDQSTTADGEARPFLKVSLRDHRHIQTIRDKLRNASERVKYLFSSTCSKQSCEANIPYHLRFMVDHKLRAMAWLKIPLGKYERISADNAISHCQLEVSVRAEDLLICDTVDNREKFAPLRILSFDIESDVPPRAFPTARRQAVIQIGSMVSTYGQPDPSVRAIFTLKTCSPIPGAQVFSFQNEVDMLTAWKKFFIEVDPDLVIGYNITQFDISYLLNRARLLKLSDFAYLGRIKSIPQYLEGWRPGFLKCPGYEGRLLLDVYHHIREHHPGLPGEGAYKLNNISMRFLGENKEDISYNDIPKLQNGSADTRRDLAIYCLKDVYLPLRLLSKLECFEVEVREAKAAHVPFNAMREKRYLKLVAKRCVDAIEQEYLVPDDP